MFFTLFSQESTSAFPARDLDNCVNRSRRRRRGQTGSGRQGLAVMAAKKKGAAKKAASRSRRKPKRAAAMPDTPSTPLPETRDASRPPR